MYIINVTFFVYSIFPVIGCLFPTLNIHSDVCNDITTDDNLFTPINVSENQSRLMSQLVCTN